MKDKIKNVPFLKSIYYFFKRILFIKVFFDDYLFYIKNFINSKTTISKLKFEMLLIVHSLEKGMTNDKPRPFGKRKIKDLIILIRKYFFMTSKISFEIEMSINILREYLNFCEKNDFINESEYIFVSDFLGKYNYIEKIDMSSEHIKIDDIDDNFDFDKFLSSRHSIRRYSSIALSQDDIKKSIEIAIKGPSACNRQMCRVYYINSENGKNLIKKYGQGFGNFDLSNANFFLITFDVSAFYTVGERNQGWFNSGIFASNLVNAFHSLGIGSCMVQFGNSFKVEKEIKKKLKIGSSERIGVIISAGYYLKDNVVTASHRRKIDDCYIVR